MYKSIFSDPISLIAHSVKLRENTLPVAYLKDQSLDIYVNDISNMSDKLQYHDTNLLYLHSKFIEKTDYMVFNKRKKQANLSKVDTYLIELTECI